MARILLRLLYYLVGIVGVPNHHNIKDEVIYEPSTNGEEKYLLRAKIMNKNKVENLKGDK